MTTSRMTSGDELKRRNGLGGSALDLRLILADITPLLCLPRWSNRARSLNYRDSRGWGRARISGISDGVPARPRRACHMSAVAPSISDARHALVKGQINRLGVKSGMGLTPRHLGGIA